MLRNTKFKSTIKDITAGLRSWRLVFYLAWDDVKQRYVRTFLGPFWLVLGTLVWAVVMGGVVAALFNQSLTKILPFVTSGVLIWNFIAGFMNESCQTFISAAQLMQSLKLPTSLYIFRFLTRNFIIFLHNLTIVIFIIIIFPVPINSNTFLFIPGLLLLALNAFWIGTFISILGTRYRDVQPMIATSMSVLPFVTPIFWDKAFLKKHIWIGDVNPFYHYVELVRAPLLGQQASVLSWTVVIGITVIGLVFTLYFYTRYRERVFFWL